MCDNFSCWNGSNGFGSGKKNLIENVSIFQAKTRVWALNNTARDKKLTIMLAGNRDVGSIHVAFNMV